jgi:Na+-driven multidrug efflux pump
LKHISELNKKAKQQYYLRISAAIINIICPILFITLAIWVKGAAIGKILSNAVMSNSGCDIINLRTKCVFFQNHNELIISSGYII